MTVEYTIQEGGEWKKLNIRKPKGKILAQLLSFNRDKGKGYPLSRSYLKVRGKFLKVHSVKFPSGEIFDSYFCDYRPNGN